MNQQDICVICGLPIDVNEVRRGAGDGSGQSFAHEVCWLARRVEELEPKAAQWDEQVAASERSRTCLDALIGSLADQTEPDLSLDPEEMAAIFKECESCGETFCDCCYECIQLNKEIVELKARNAELQFRLTSVSEALWKRES